MFCSRRQCIGQALERGGANPWTKATPLAAVGMDATLAGPVGDCGWLRCLLRRH